MKITELARRVSKLEGGKKNLSITQIMEVLKCVDKVTKGFFYKLVKIL